jgi:hypothetical protein
MFLSMFLAGGNHLAAGRHLADIPTPVEIAPPRPT